VLLAAGSPKSRPRTSQDIRHCRTVRRGRRRSAAGSLTPPESRPTEGLPAPPGIDTNRARSLPHHSANERRNPSRARFRSDARGGKSRGPSASPGHACDDTAIAGRFRPCRPVPGGRRSITRTGRLFRGPGGRNSALPIFRPSGTGEWREYPLEGRGSVAGKQLAGGLGQHVFLTGATQDSTPGVLLRCGDGKLAVARRRPRHAGKARRRSSS